jgi:outer membrane protein OmpA-like peptidoglycan-associated protein
MICCILLAVITKRYRLVPLLTIWVLVSVLGVSPQERDFRLLLEPGEKIRITEKANLRRYENGSFKGLSFREVRGILEVDPGSEDSVSLSGRYYIFEETKHDDRLVAKRIDEVQHAQFLVDPRGGYHVDEVQVQPSLRNFPALPKDPISPGAYWEAFGVRVVQPFRDRPATRVRFYSSYRYRGIEQREGKDYAVIAAQYAMRYKQGDDPYGDEQLVSISGKHVVTLYLDRITMKPVYQSDVMDEEYLFDDDRSVGFKGFILTWMDDVVSMDRQSLAEQVEQTLEDAGTTDVSVEEREEGVVLTLNRIHFVADQAVILPEEESRLAAIADSLGAIEGRSFLVVGHTARVGSEESQITLSIERAKAVVDYMVAEGIEASRFLYEGRGGSEPVAPNDTEENRARNRRVEIFVLED